VTVPREWEAIHRNEPLRREITELMLMASDLNIIDWVKPEATRPRALSWDKTKRTTAKVCTLLPGERRDNCTGVYL
jgi:hypothetical protein